MGTKKYFDLNSNAISIVAPGMQNKRKRKGKELIIVRRFICYMLMLRKTFVTTI